MYVINDDDSTGSQDNNPYSAAEISWKPAGKPPQKNPVGYLSNFDWVRAPGVIDAAGANGDTLEHRVQFRDFARLQIGDSAAPGYKNWYRISDYSLWRHHAKWKKVGGTWVDDGSVSDKTNNGW